MSNIRQAQLLLDTLFGDAPSETYLLLWTKAGKQSRFFTVDRLGDAALTATTLGRTTDVYIGCGLRDRDHGPRSRGTVVDVVGIPGLWADIDAEKAGTAKSYFKTRDAVVQFLNSLPIAPTIRVWSGGGYHAWWLFKEPWIFTDDAERTQAATLSRRWQLMLMHEARAVGAEIDATHDLARVLRVPGTTNHKYGVPVELIDADGPRGNPSDFTECCADIPETEAAAIALNGVGVGSFVLRRDAEPPADKLAVLLANDTWFERSWTRERPDLKDQSASSYDQSLASLAVHADWTDQEIVDLLIAGRRRHGNKLKLRKDYYERTLQTARATTAENPTLETALMTALGL